MGLGRFGISPLLHRGIEAVRCCLCPLTYVPKMLTVACDFAEVDEWVQLPLGALNTSRGGVMATSEAHNLEAVGSSPTCAIKHLEVNT